MSEIRDQLEAKLVEAILLENTNNGVTITLEEVLAKAKQMLDDIEKTHGKKL